MSLRTLFAALLLCAVLMPVGGMAAQLKTPSKPFDETKPPPAPDYSDRGAWLVWPGVKSNADLVPEGIKGTVVRNPDVDVFFIHPTTYLENATWNAKYDQDGFTATQLTDGVLRYQTSVFNGCCRIYAPRYRQATISAFLKPGKDSNSAYGLAYSDVLRAFDYFIANENRGRPFILASHSQGSLHATRLLQERIVGDAGLRKRLVVAYVIGAAMPEPSKGARLPLCGSAEQTGCIVDWNTTSSLAPLALGRRIMMTYGDGRYQEIGKRKWACVNPLTWTRDGVAKAGRNAGSLPASEHGKPLLPIVEGLTGARCTRGRLAVSIPWGRRKGFVDPLTRLGSYHNHDYNLFYASIRQNAIDRVAAYRRQKR